ncbi:unnamed protein product [Rangifer tarandus platyrhynchus]|uniref:Uncharacterized protein n=1 Tax=Rangifer tarandus platyrhynchus TaxID=3082113 RepID=A0AC59Z3B3_RANTA
MLVVIAINSKHSGTSSACLHVPGCEFFLLKSSAGDLERAYSTFRGEGRGTLSNRHRGQGRRDGRQVPLFKKEPWVWRREDTDVEGPVLPVLEGNSPREGGGWLGPQPSLSPPHSAGFSGNKKESAGYNQPHPQPQMSTRPCREDDGRVSLRMCSLETSLRGVSSRTWVVALLASEEGEPGRVP